MNGSTIRNRMRRHTWEREYVKIALQYALMLLAAFVAGWLLPRFFSETLWQNVYERVFFHFSPVNPQPIMQTAYRFAKPLLICVLAIFIFSFSSLTCLVSDGFLVYLGARTGCACSVLYAFLQAMNSQTDAPLPMACFLFVLFHLLLLIGFFLFSLCMAKYSYRLRVYSKEGRTLFHPATVLMLILHTVVCAALFFLLHVLYSYGIYLLSK